MEKVINILMRRDGISREEAIEAIEDCREEINYFCARGDYLAAEESITTELGLEPDYIFDILF